MVSRQRSSKITRLKELKEPLVSPTPRVIAEFCQNHNGDFDILRRMLDAAIDAGATYAKIQTIFADDLSYRERFETGLINPDGEEVVIRRPFREEYERLKNLEISYEQQALFVSLCLSAGIEPLTTAFTVQSIPIIRNCGFRSIKIASYDCASLPLISEATQNFQEVIVSTGATYKTEIESTVSFLRKSMADFVLLHCVTLYPTPFSSMNLQKMLWLKDLSSKFGLSSHPLTSTDGILADLVALSLGANYIERHFTILPADQTRDGKVSINPHQLREIVEFGRLSQSDQLAHLTAKYPHYASCIGEIDFELGPKELLNRDYYRGRFCNKINGNEVPNWEFSIPQMSTDAKEKQSG